MATFKNVRGEEFLLTISTDSIREIAAITGVNIARLGEDPAVDDAMGDLLRLTEFIHILCRPQMYLPPVTTEERLADRRRFESGLIGDALAAAQEAFWDAYMAFTPSRQRREAMLAAKEQNLAVEAKKIELEQARAKARAAREIKKMEAEAAAPEESQPIPGVSSTSSPAASE